MPRNGVFFPWLRSESRCTVQAADGAKMQQSAAAPGRNVGVGSPMMDAGAVVTLSIAREIGTFISVAHLSISGNSISSPVAPGSASPNGTCLPSSSTGA
jgi:hypothetical protein